MNILKKLLKWFTFYTRVRHTYKVTWRRKITIDGVIWEKIHHIESKQHDNGN